MIKLTKLNDERKRNKLLFLLKGSDEVFANTIRRLIIEEVPTLAVEDLEIKDNSSALYDEMLGLRLGLIPIRTDLKSYRLPESEAEIEERSARCTLQLHLKTGKNGLVYAEDATSADPKCTFVYPRMPVVKLGARQKIDVIITAVMGQGKDHAKWSPGTAFYKKEPVVTLGSVKNPQLVAAKCSDNVFTLKAGGLSINKDHVHTSNLLEYYTELDKGIKVEYTDNLIFTVEGWGQLSCKEMLAASVDILLHKAEELEQQL